MSTSKAQGFKDLQGLEVNAAESSFWVPFSGCFAACLATTTTATTILRLFVFFMFPI